jgi:hypothetical protein
MLIDAKRSISFFRKPLAECASDIMAKTGLVTSLSSNAHHRKTMSLRLMENPRTLSKLSMEKCHLMLDFRDDCRDSSGHKHIRKLLAGRIRNFS